MTTIKLPVFELFKTAYRDLRHVVFAMPMLAGFGVLIVLAVSVADALAPSALWSVPVLGSILGFLVTVVRSILLAPILIAAHRYIVLGELTSGYALDPGDPSFRAFVGWQVALVLLSTVTAWLSGLAQGVDNWFVSTVVFLVLTFIGVFIAIRLSILLPAIAVGAANPTAKSAWEDTKGHAFHIFLVFLLVSLPIGLVVVGMVLILGPGADAGGSASSVVSMVIGSPLQIALLFVYVSVASRTYQAIGQRVNTPA